MNEAWIEVRDWRKAKRAELIAQREALEPVRHRQMNAAISAHIEAGFALLAGMTIGFCWPFKGEFDARFVIRHFREQGAAAALPVVVAKATPLQFRAWWPGAPMSKGVYDIPIPDGTALVVPDAAIVPMNGFDGQAYRLGYGGGYFDRTLDSMSPQLLAIGVAFEFAGLPTIRPQPHDVPMDFVVTEAGIYVARNASLARISAEQCREQAARLCAQRGLPRQRVETAAGFASPPCYAGEFPGYFGEPDDTKADDPKTGDTRN
ncbi:MAG: 5-formyltetrahydrofolate cyclo-ligase [Burkholderiales bacterium]